MFSVPRDVVRKRVLPTYCQITERSPWDIVRVMINTGFILVAALPDDKQILAFTAG